MFGYYTNRRITESESKILYGEPDDYNWYLVYLQNIFREARFFQVREDIELPQDDDGVVLMFQGRDVAYFKTLDGDVTENEVKSIYEVCSFLENKFDCPITAYVVCPSDAKIIPVNIKGEGNITMVFSLLKNDDGEEIIERLESKLKNKEKFSVGDSIDHMLLPFTGFKNKEVFEEKLNHYMQLVNEYGGGM